MHSTFGVHNVNGPTKRIVNVDQVDPAGGDVAIVTVNDSSTVREVRIGGFPCSFFTVSSTKVAVITPSKDEGVEDIQLKFSSGAVARSTITYWSPVDANTTLCVERGDFVDQEWKDRSGNGRHFTESTSPPVETNREPQFNTQAAATYLTGTTNTITAANIFSASGSTYSISIMFRVRRLLAPNASWYLSSPLLGENSGHIGTVVTDSYIRHRVYSGAENYVEIASAPSLDEWHVLDIESSAGSARMRLDGGAWTGFSSLGVPSLDSGVFQIGQVVSSDRFYGDVRAIVVSNIARGSTWFDNLQNWFKVRHGFAPASEPELDEVDSDVFNPAGGDVVHLRGRNIAAATDVKFGVTSYETIPAIGTHASFDGTNDVLRLAYTRPQLLGGSGWTFSALVDCRDLPADSGPTASSTIFTEDQQYVGVSVFKGGAYVWQYESTGMTINEAVTGGVGNGIHLIQAQWTGTHIRIRIDGGEWASTALSSIGGSITGFRFGANYNNSGAFFKGRLIETFFADSVLTDTVLDSVVRGHNSAYGLKLGDGTAIAFDCATLSLTAYFKPTNYILAGSATWNGTASAGSSSGRNLTEATNPPSSVTASAIGIKSFGAMPVFDGDGDILSTALTFNDLFGSGGFSGWVLLNPNTVVGRSSTIYLNDVLLGTATNAYFVITLRNDGKAYIRAVGSLGGETLLAVNLHGGWNLLQWRCDGSSTLYFRCNGDDWVSSSGFGVMHVSGLGDTLAVGAIPSYSSNEYNGRIAEIGMAATDIGVAGSDGIVAYVNHQYGLKLGGYGAYNYQPTSLALSLFCRAGDYTTGTWTGTASAGSSSGRNLTGGASNIPTVSTSEITCRTPAVSAGATLAAAPLFDGTDDKLGGPGETAPTIEDTFGVTAGSSNAGSYIILFRANSAIASNPQVYANPGLLVQVGGSAAGNGCSYSTAGVKFGHYDGTWDEITIAAPVGEWHVAQAKWDGVNLYARILTHDTKPGAWQSISRGAFMPASSGGYLELGGQYDDARWLHGVIAEVMTIGATLSDAAMDNIVRYMNMRHGLNLGHYGASLYDPAVLALTTWFRPGGYSLGTWTGVASAGTSGSQNLGETTATNMPEVTSEIVPTELPISVVNSSGPCRLAKAIRFATPGTLPNVVWWLHGDSGITPVNDGTVSSWADQSGAGDSGRNVAPTGDAVLYRRSSAYNGRTVIDDQQAGASRLLRAGAAWSKTYHTYTISTIGHGKTTGNTYYVHEDGSMYNTIIDQSGTPGLYSLGASELINGAGFTNQPRTFMLGIFNGASSRFHVEDNVGAAGTFTNTHVLGGFRGYVGSYSSDTTSYGVTALADVVAYSRVLTLEEIRLLRRYRDSYYGKVLI